MAPLKSLVLLKKEQQNAASHAVSTANLTLPDADVQDLERYLDVSRGEIPFAKGVILVEGDSEVYLVPALGKLLGTDFDRLGFTVCSVAGTNFAPYVKLLGPQGLDLPFAVLTDLDPQRDGTNLGEPRVEKLRDLVGTGRGPNQGIFLNTHTLEVDLFECGRHKSMCATLYELAPSNAAKTRTEGWCADPKSLDKAQFLRDIKAIGKGRFAQRLASRLTGTRCPPYIKDAIEHVKRHSR